MPQAIPFIIAAASVAAAGNSIYQGQAQATASKKAADANTASTNKALADAQQKDAAAAQSLKDSQANASSQAQAALKAKAAAYSDTVYTSPLGLSTQADTSKKLLLGN